MMIDENNTPIGWTVRSLAEVCSVVTDGTHKTPKYVEKGVPFISIANIQPFSPISYKRYEKYISKDEHEELSRRAKAEKGDILFPRIGTLGYAKRIDWNYEVSIFVGLGLAKPKRDVIDPKFLELYMNTQWVDRYSRNAANGSGRLTLPLAASRIMPVPVPPMSLQLSIVSKIEELFSELDKGIENLRLAQQQLKTYRQSVLKWAFEGKLTNANEDVRRNGIESLSMVAEELKEYGSKLPKGWKWVKIERLLSPRRKGMTTGPFGTMLKKNEHQENGVAVLGIENIGEGVFQMPNRIFITKSKALELKAFTVKENDIIISRSGTVGEICLVPRGMDDSVISTNLIRVSLDEEVINPSYFIYLFQGGNVRQQVFDLCKGSSRAFLNQTILNALNFPCCAIQEQEKVIEEIESRFSVADKMEESINQSLQQAEALRQSILKKAFDGRLVIIPSVNKS